MNRSRLLLAFPMTAVLLALWSATRPSTRPAPPTSVRDSPPLATAPAPPGTFVPDARLSYEIYELASGGRRRLLSSGTRAYSSRDEIAISEMGRGDSGHWSKRLLLDASYGIDADTYREASVAGFGLVVSDRSKPLGFSWNWFDRQQGDLFVKRQGHGSLRVAVRTVGTLTEISEIEFLDDVDLRFTDNVFVHLPGTSTNVIRVLKGSILRLPEAQPARATPTTRGAAEQGIGADERRHG